MCAQIRRSKKSDQSQTEICYNILRDAMESHQEMEQSLWAGACWSALVNGYLNCGISYEDFCRDFDEAKEFYRVRWGE